MSNPLVVTLVTIALIIASGFFVIIEFALLGARRHRLELEAADSRGARSALRGMNELTLMLAGAQLGITVVTFALGAITKPAVDAWLGPLLASWGVPGWLAGGASFALSLFFVTFLHLVVGEMAPKSWAIAHPETAAKLVSPPARAFVWIARPLLLLINNLANRLVAASGITPVDRAAAGGQDAATIRQLVEHSAKTGALEGNFERQIRSVIDLEHVTLGDMVPEGQRPASVGSDATVAEVQDVAVGTGHLRIIVAEPDGNVARVVHVRDTLLEDSDVRVGEIARPAFILPSATPVYEALARMREKREQLAVVGDSGVTIGVVSVSDILHRVLPTRTLVQPAVDPDAGHE